MVGIGVWGLGIGDWGIFYLRVQGLSWRWRNQAETRRSHSEIKRSDSEMRRRHSEVRRSQKHALGVNPMPPSNIPRQCTPKVLGDRKPMLRSTFSEYTPTLGCTPRHTPRYAVHIFGVHSWPFCLICTHQLRSQTGE